MDRWERSAMAWLIALPARNRSLNVPIWSSSPSCRVHASTRSRFR